jgi:DNA-binding CsgD family transcriptional regulator
LTPRELDVLRLMATSHTNCACAVIHGLGRSLVGMQRFHTRADVQL